MKSLKLKILSFIYLLLAIFWRLIDSAKSTAYRLKSERLTYLSLEALVALAEKVQAIEKDGIDGDIIETGSALGGSAILISKSKSQKRPFKVLDVFGMIPPPTEKDGEDVHKRFEVIESGKAKGIQGDEYYGYKTDLMKEVELNFNRFGVDLAKNNVELVPGLFQDTLQAEGKVSLAHIDCDWYDSVMVCLERITPRLVEKGVMVMDDYYDWSGCRDATDDYFKDKQDQFTFETVANKLHITKLPVH